MAISFRCECGRHLSAGDELVGRRVKCPACQRHLTVPSGSVPAPAAAPHAALARRPAGPEPPPPPPAFGPSGEPPPVPAHAAGGAPPPPPAHGLPAPRAPQPTHRGHRADEAARARGVLCLGIALLAGFLLPVVIPSARETKVIFPNILVLGEDSAPILVKLMCFYPAVAGIAVTVLAYTCRGIGRSITLMGLGLLPIVLLAADRDVQRVLGEMARALGPSAGAVAILGLLGATGVFAGSRSRSICPGSRLAAIVGAVGAGLSLLSLLIPTEMPGLRRSSTTIGLIQPFGLLNYGHMALLGVTGIVAMGLGIAACILCLVNVTPRANGGSLARLAFWLLVADFLVSVAGGMLFAITAQGGPPGEAILPALLMAIKMGCWVLGILLLMPVGLTHLILDTSSGGTGGSGPTAGGGDPGQRIRRLQELLREGMITQEEFARKRAEIVSGM